MIASMQELEMSDQMSHTRLGVRLRELRLAQKLSVRTLAAQSGFSPSFISNIESETVSPSIASLEKIARALGVTLGALFSSLESPARLIVRRSERVIYRSTSSAILAAVLTDSDASRQLSAVEVTLAPGSASGAHAAPVSHDLVALVLDGALELVVHAHPDQLASGDSAYLRRGTSVVWRNPTEQPATLLLVSVADRADLVIERFLEAHAGHRDDEGPIGDG
jgi:transcriptional regulator with XRE-family HTH domain